VATLSPPVTVPARPASPSARRLYASLAARFAGVLVVLLAGMGEAARAADPKPETSFRILWGDGFDDEYYELNTSDGRMTSLVGRHWRPWSRGDHYIWLGVYEGHFVEVADGTTPRGRLEYYAAWWPRLSLSKAAKKSLAWGPIADVYASAELATGLGFDSASIGVSVDLRVPGCTYVGAAVYRRDDSLGTPAAQGTIWWVCPLKAGRTTVTTEGYLYAAGTDDVGLDFYGIAQVVADIGVFMGQPARRFHAGVEWYYHDTREQSISAPQAILRWDW
jgi:hypothetical protein